MTNREVEAFEEAVWRAVSSGEQSFLTFGEMADVLRETADKISRQEDRTVLESWEIEGYTVEVVESLGDRELLVDGVEYTDQFAGWPIDKYLAVCAVEHHIENEA